MITIRCLVRSGARTKRQSVTFEQVTPSRRHVHKKSPAKPSKDERTRIFNAAKTATAPIVSPKLPASAPLPEITEDDRKRVYILGTGTKSSAWAADFGLNPTPVTLLTQEKRRIDDFDAVGRKITVRRPDGTILEVGGAKVELYKKVSSADDSDDPDRSLYGTRPILNLIFTTRNSFAPENLAEIKHRLTPQSTIIIAQDGMGVVEKMIKKNFPDPRYRPTIRIAVASLAVEGAGEQPNKMKVSYEGNRAIYEGSGSNKGYDFKIREADTLNTRPTTMKIGPIVDLFESLEMMSARENASHYIVNLLTNNQLFESKVIPQHDLVYVRIRRLVMQAVLEPLGVLKDCNYGHILDNPEDIAIARELALEALKICRWVVHQRLTLEDIMDWVTSGARHLTNAQPTMLVQVAIGRPTDIDSINGWLIDYGRRCNPPIHLPYHERIIEKVKAKAAYRLAEIEAEKKARSGDSNSDRSIHRVDSTTEDSDFYEPGAQNVQLDKHELWHKNKADRQRNLAGKQPQPDSYTSPKISPMGNLKIIRK